MAKPLNDQFTKGETQRRFEAALRGARIAREKPAASVTPKRKPKQPARKPK